MKLPNDNAESSSTELGFDPQNLEAAVGVVLGLAAKVGQDQTWLVRGPNGGKLQTFDLTARDGVREYLMTKSELAYVKAGRGFVAQIRETVYAGVGVVFEENLGEMNPPPVTRSDGRPLHLAYFWQVL